MHRASLSDESDEVQGALTPFARPPVLRRIARALYRAASVPDQHLQAFSHRLRTLTELYVFAVGEALDERLPQASYTAQQGVVAQRFTTGWRKALRLKARDAPWLAPLESYLAEELPAAVADGGGSERCTQPDGSFELRIHSWCVSPPAACSWSAPRPRWPTTRASTSGARAAGRRRTGEGLRGGPAWEGSTSCGRGRR